MPFSGHVTKLVNANCVSSRGGKKKANAEAGILKSVNTSASKCYPSSVSAGRSPEKHKKDGKQSTLTGLANSTAGYQQPTVSSRARALSPYTHRKMCQLSEEAQQRLSHLQLGPHQFRKETESQRPFLVSNNTYTPLNSAQVTRTS